MELSIFVMLQCEAGGCDLQLLAELLPLLGLTVDGKARGKPLHLAAHLQMDKKYHFSDSQPSPLPSQKQPPLPS